MKMGKNREYKQLSGTDIHDFYQKQHGKLFIYSSFLTEMEKKTKNDFMSLKYNNNSKKKS